MAVCTVEVATVIVAVVVSIVVSGVPIVFGSSDIFMKFGIDVDTDVSNVFVTKVSPLPSSS